MLASQRLFLPSWPWPGGEATYGADEISVINVQGDQSFIVRIFIYVNAEELRGLDPVPVVVTPVYWLKPESVHNPNEVKTLLAHEGLLLISLASPFPLYVMRLRWIAVSPRPPAGLWTFIASGSRGEVVAAWDQLPATPT